MRTEARRPHRVKQREGAKYCVIFAPRVIDIFKPCHNIN
jgi:hypothetical protein